MKPLAEQTLYEILEVAETAPAAEIQRAYERARALYAPGSLATYTLMAPDEMALLGRRIEEARSVLLDPVARAGYDARLASGTPLPQAGRTDDSTPQVSATRPPHFEGARDVVSAPPLPAQPAFAAPVPQPSFAEPAPQPAFTAPAPPPPAGPSRAPPAGAATHEPAPPAVPEMARGPAQVIVPEGTRWTGEMLRRAREARGLTVRQMAERTKITRHHIENVEADRFGQLPVPVYLRGIVMCLARELRLDGQKVARSYLEHVAAHHSR